MKTVEERFWAKVDQTGSEDYPDCWEWSAYTLPTGYGQFGFRKQTWLAHRVSWVLHNGEIPEGMCVLHIECDNPPCVNPDHLKPGTHADNMRDMFQKGRDRNQNTDKTHCPKGHSYSGDNLYILPNTGSRQCCECRRIRVRGWRARQKERVWEQTTV